MTTVKDTKVSSDKPEDKLSKEDTGKNRKDEQKKQPFLPKAGEVVSLMLLVGFLLLFALGYAVLMKKQ